MSNLLPPEQKRSILRLYRKRFLSLCFAAFILLALAGCALLLPSLVLLRSSESLLSEKRDALASNDTTTITKSLASAVSDINSRLSVFSANPPASPVIADFIDPILASKTPAIHIANLSYTLSSDPNAANIQILGTADSREDLLAFADTLRQVKTFTNVNVPIASFLKDSSLTFTISATAALK